MYLTKLKILASLNDLSIEISIGGDLRMGVSLSILLFLSLAVL